MGYHSQPCSNKQAASYPGRSPLKAADSKRGSAAARLNGATRVRFSYGLPVLAGFVRAEPRPTGRDPLKAADSKRGSAAARLAGATRVRFSCGLPLAAVLQQASRVLPRTQPSQGG